MTYFVGSWSRLVDHSIEAIVVIGGVINSAHGTIGLHQGVLSLHDITIALLGLRLDVAGVGILNAIVEGVLGVRLLRQTIKY